MVSGFHSRKAVVGVLGALLLVGGAVCDRVYIKSPEPGQVVSGGDEMFVHWEEIGSDKVDPAHRHVELVEKGDKGDENRIFLGDFDKNIDRFTWHVPDGLNTNNYYIMVTTKDNEGRQSHSYSGLFGIDSGSASGEGGYVSSKQVDEGSKGGHESLLRSVGSKGDGDSHRSYNDDAEYYRDSKSSEDRDYGKQIDEDDGRQIFVKYSVNSKTKDNDQKDNIVNTVSKTMDSLTEKIPKKTNNSDTDNSSSKGSSSSKSKTSSTSKSTTNGPSTIGIKTSIDEDSPENSASSLLAAWVSSALISLSGIFVFLM